MIRTAIVGAGGIAELHVSAMKRLDARPAAVIAETEDEARAFAARHGDMFFDYGNPYRHAQRFYGIDNRNTSYYSNFCNPNDF